MYQNETLDECYPAVCLTQKPRITNFHQYRRELSWVFTCPQIFIIYYYYYN